MGPTHVVDDDRSCVRRIGAALPPRSRAKVLTKVAKVPDAGQCVHLNHAEGDTFVQGDGERLLVTGTSHTATIGISQPAVVPVDVEQDPLGQDLLYSGLQRLEEHHTTVQLWKCVRHVKMVSKLLVGRACR